MLLSELRNLIKERLLLEGLIDDIKKEFPGREIEWDQAKSELLQNGVKENQLAQYLKWLWKQAKGTEEPIGDITPLIITFNKIREKGSIWKGSKDINAWTRNSLQDEINRLPKVQDKEKKKEREGADYVTKSGKWSIYIPMNEGESIQISHMGGEKSTSWCTSRTSGNLYYAYILGDAVLYYILNNKNPAEKFCIGAKNGEVVVQGAGGVTVTAKNAAFTEPMQKRVFKNDYQEIINFIRNHCNSIGGKHPAKKDIEEAATSLPKLKYMMKGWRVSDMAVLLRSALNKIEFSKDCIMWMIDNQKEFSEALNAVSPGYNFFNAVKDQIVRYGTFNNQELEALNTKYPDLGFIDLSVSVNANKFTKKPELFVKEFLEAKSANEKSLLLKSIFRENTYSDSGDGAAFTSYYYTNYKQWKPVVDFIINNYNDIVQYYSDKNRIIKILFLYSKFLNKELTEKLNAITESNPDIKIPEIKTIKIHNEIKNLMSGDSNTFQNAVKRHLNFRGGDYEQQRKIFSIPLLANFDYSDSNITKENLDFLLNTFNSSITGVLYGERAFFNKSFLSQIMKFYSGDELENLLINSLSTPDNILESLLINNINNEKFKKIFEGIVKARINTSIKYDIRPLIILKKYLEKNNNVKISIDNLNWILENMGSYKDISLIEDLENFLKLAIKNLSKEELEIYKSNIGKFPIKAGSQLNISQVIARSLAHNDVLNMIKDSFNESAINQKIMSYSALEMSQFINEAIDILYSKNDTTKKIIIETILNCIINRGFSGVIINESKKRAVFNWTSNLYEKSGNSELLLKLFKPETHFVEIMNDVPSINPVVNFLLNNIVDNTLRYQLFKDLSRVTNQNALKNALFDLIASRHDDKTIVTALTAIKEAGKPETVLKLINAFNNANRKKVILIRLQRNGWLDWFGQEMQKRNYVLESLYKRVFNRLQTNYRPFR